MRLFNLILPLSFAVNALADSATFTMKVYAPNSDILKECNVYISDDDKFYISNATTTTNTAVVLTNGSLHISDKDIAVGIGKNFLSLTAESASYQIAAPWSIQDGFLKLYASDFHAVPSGEDGIYVMGSINAAVGRSDMIELQVKAVDSDGNSVANYNIASSVTSSATGKSTSTQAIGATSTSGSNTLTRLSSTNGGVAPVAAGSLVLAPLAAILLL
jgi:hypothetical protein